MAKRALCCGINYKRHENYQLYGCSNDCLDWVELFKNTFQFDDVRVLIDEHPDGSLATAPTQIPTRANILAQLNWLCSGAEPGDCLAFVFAGHGCQVRSSYAPVAGALVPEDFDQRGDSGPSLVMDDELHALFQRLPPGAFITVVLDCCHGDLMLDVPCSMVCDQGACRTLKACERPREVPDRTEDAWRQAALADRMKHAYARPRFLPTVTLSGPPRQRRTPEGSGAHVGRMTLDPGVTAFCFSASTGPQTALDANIKAHQRGVMSFCLLEALAATKGRCTYQTLLEKASEKMDDIRSKYMPDMDQIIQLSFCPNSEPKEVVILDPRYANVSQHRLSQQLGDPGGMMPLPQAHADQHPGAHQPPREPSGDNFVPAPAHAAGGNHAATPSSAVHPPAEGGSGGQQGHHHHHGPQGGPMLYLVIHAAYNLVGRPGERPSPESSTWVVARLGSKEHKTHTVHGGMATVWSEHNHFSFQVDEPGGALDVEVLSADHSRGAASLGRLRVPLRSLEPGQWLRRREPLQDSNGADLEFDIRLEPSRQQHPGAAGAAEMQHSQVPQQGAQPQQAQQRPPSPLPSPVAHDHRPPSPRRPPQDAGFAPFGPPLGEPVALQPGCAGLGGAAGACGGGRLGGLGASHHASDFGGSEWDRPGVGRCPPGSIFGMPNLFGAIPHMLPGAGGPGSAAASTFGSALGGRPGSAALASRGMAASPYPSASLGLDLNHNGRADLIVQGVDLNRNGIPDALEGALAQAPTYAQPQYSAAMAPEPYAQPRYATGVPFPSPTPVGTAAGARVAAAYGMGHAGVSGTPMAWQYMQQGATY